MKFSVWLEAKKIRLNMGEKSPEELLALADTLEAAYKTDENRNKHISRLSNAAKYFPGGPTILLHYTAQIAKNLASLKSGTGTESVLKYENHLLLREFPPEFREVLGL
jgi:hypothetical protein